MILVSLPQRSCHRTSSTPKIPNNAYYRRKQITEPNVFNKTARNGRVFTTVGFSVSNLTTPELGSPSGGPAQTSSGNVNGGKFEQN